MKQMVDLKGPQMKEEAAVKVKEERERMSQEKENNFNTMPLNRGIFLLNQFQHRYLRQYTYPTRVSDKSESPVHI